MLKEIENLSKALRTQQEKAEAALQRKTKESKKVRNAKDQIEYLKHRVDDLKRNEENLLQDLVQQQAIAKDALKSLDNLRDVMTSEKSMMKEELDHYYSLLLEQEREKYQSLYSRYRNLENADRKLKEYELKYSNSEHLVKDQKTQIHNLQSMLDNANAKAENLHDELTDTKVKFEAKVKEFKREVSYLTKHQRLTFLILA